MNPVALVLLFASCVAASGSSASFRMESSPQLLSVQRDTIPIVRFSQDIRAGSDVVSFESGNGIVLEDQTQVVQGRGGSYEDGQGRLIQTDRSVVKTGTYTYTSPEGLPITVRWTADENGFRAEGDHLPVPPAQEALPVRAAAPGPAHILVSRQ